MTDSPRIYLDYAATTPILDAARAACLDGFAHWANPSSPHSQGRAAQSVLENARKRLKTALDWDGELIFTSGASEAISIALNHSKAQNRVVSPTEHDAVLRLCENSEKLSVDKNGQVEPDRLAQLLNSSDAPALVAVQSVNNETGIIQNFDAILPIVKEQDALLLADCSQSAGKMPLPDADMIVIAAHKFGGPPGVGALLVKDFKLLKAIGGQEHGYRPGTQNLPYILAMVAALEAPSNWAGRAMELRTQLDNAIKNAGGAVIAENAPRIATIASYHMPGVAANTQLIKFDMAGFAISAGSACSSGTLKPSHVLTAMGIDPAIASQSIRVSIGRNTTRTEIYSFIECWTRIFTEVRKH